MPLEESEGRPFGRFRLHDLLGEGGGGTVYRAWDSAHSRFVALKLLKNAVRQVREAHVLARLTHKNIVTMHEAGEHDGQSFLVMELVQGLPLHVWLASKPPLNHVLKVFKQVCAAIEYAHEQGVIHRDLKPSNVLVHEQLARVVDFGLARPPHGWTVTLQGEVLGTPGFMSPEQLRGEPPTEAVDVYGLGALLYFCLSQRPPSHESPQGPRALASIALQCLEPDPKRRYPSVQALREDVERFRRGQAVRARRPRRLLAIGAAAALVVALLTALQPAADVQPELDAGRGSVEQAERLFYVADAPLPALRERIATAVEHLDAALARAPSTPDAWFLRGKARILASRPDLALPDFDRAVELAPTNPSFRLARALARAARIDNEPSLRDGALRDFETVARHTRDEGDRRLALAHRALLAGRPNEAFAQVETALKRETDRWELHALRARCAPTAGERQEAARAAVRLRPNDAVLHLQASNILEPDDPSAALPFLRESLRLLDAPSVREALVRVLRKLGSSREAVAQADLLVARAPEMGRYQRSQARLFLGDAAGAVEDLEACLRFRSSWDYWGDLASALLEAGRPKEAVDALRRAFALNTTGDRQLDATLVRLYRVFPPVIALVREVESSRPALAEIVVLDAAARAAFDFPLEPGEVLERDPFRAGLRRFAVGDYEGATGTPPASRAAALLRTLAVLCRGTSPKPDFAANAFEGSDRVAYAAYVARGATTRDSIDLQRAAILRPTRLEHRLLEALLNTEPASALLGMLHDASSR